MWCVYHISSECFQYCSRKTIWNPSHLQCSMASQFWTDFLLSLNVVIQLNVLSASVFEEGNRLSVRWILPRDGALWALTYGTGPRLVWPSVFVYVCMCILVIWRRGGGSVWDKELLSFLHLFFHSIGVRHPLPGLHSLGLLLWCQHEFTSNLQRRNNNNTEHVYPAMVLCMFSLICWNCVKLNSFKNVWFSNRQLQQAGRVVDF